MTQALLDYQRIKKAIEFITEHAAEQPQLEPIAAHVHLSPYHFQRLFLRWAGISPKKFLQYITLEHSKKRLRSGNNLAEVADTVGLSGTSRLHDLFINIEGMTPDQYKKGGLGITVHYDFFIGPFGKYLLAVTQSDKICSLFFTDDEKQAVAELNECWINSTVIQDTQKTVPVAKKLFTVSPDNSIELLVKGTLFQIKVWEALIKIPYGCIVSYQAVADYIKHPNALRAVGSAIGKNPISYLIPCHRVIRKAGHIGEYRWGSVRKRALIGWEASKKEDIET
jgi:AraC family transcriptional regulator of adaptative response/methylated-DNA-[protein]-cysteine methyltransferase